jgi:hypothetical protein
MGYYIRVLGTSPNAIPVEELRESARPALIEVEKRDGETWEHLLLKHESGLEIATIEKNLVVPGELGADELSEFLEKVPLLKPESAALWLREYLPAVKVIYAFQLLSGTDSNDGWTPLHRVYSTVWNIAGGILQADGEGFSNEEGFTIVWQFSERVTGPWNVGVLTDNAHWTHFEIDLGNAEHRERFRLGKVPVGARLVGSSPS